MGPPRSICRLCASSARQLSRASHRAPAQARWSSSQTVSKLVFSDDDGAEPSAVRHIHISSDPTSGTFPSYTAASEFQDSLRHAFLEWKSAPTARAPSPLVISFTPAPTYTLGRRQKLLTGEQSDRHGPGQIVLWPIIDLHSEYYPHQTVRSYARLLEQTTQAVLADGPGLGTYLSEEDPGVWAESARSRPGGQERKLAAMGVHLRRHISGLGTALNVDVVVDGGEKTNPWARFVPCGLEGKTATSVQTEVGAGTWEAWRAAGDERAGREWYARRWVDEFAKRLGVQPANGTVLHRLD